MIVIGAILGFLGLVAIVMRPTFLGVLVGTQILILGAASSLVLVGVSGGQPTDGILFALFVIFSGVAQIAIGFSLCVRLFYLKKSRRIDELRTLKQ